MNWDDIKIFLALMRHGTVRQAAEQLRISHSTVARRIEAMETKLGVNLFDRLPMGYVLTTAGKDMLETAEQVETEFIDLEMRILGHDHKLSGRIRVTMVDALATHFLMPYLTEFAKQYPDIELEIEVSYEVANLDLREADVALRFSKDPPGHLIGRRLLTCSVATYVSHDYLKTHDLHDARQNRWIGFGASNPFPKWVKESEFPNIPAKGIITSLSAQLEACKSGLGMSMLPCFIGDPEPNLCRITEAALDPAFELWLLTHRNTRANARLRVFADFLANTIKKHHTLFEGEGGRQTKVKRDKAKEL